MPEVVRSYIGKTGAFEEPSGGAVSKIGGVKDAQLAKASASLRHNGVLPYKCPTDLILATTFNPSQFKALCKPMNADNLYHREYKPLLKKARLSGFTFHSLRHTCATLLCSKNVNPKIVQEMMGHANISQTMDTYSHVMPGMQDEAAERLQRLLFGATPVVLLSEEENAEKNRGGEQEKIVYLQEE